MEENRSKEEYLAAVCARASLPRGFKTAAQRLSFFPAEIGGEKEYPMNLSLILLDEPTDSFHALFTKNLFCGAPVLIGKQRLMEKRCRGILVNNKISNVAATGGVEDAHVVLRALARELGDGENLFFPASTGIIGWKIPVREMCENIPALVKNLNAGPLLPVAEAIMTTDSYPKIRSAECCGGRIVAVAKGAGMIEPNMGTLLAFVLTDLAVPRPFLAECLRKAVGESLNTISIDGDQSTSDMAIMLSSGKIPLTDKAGFYRTLRHILSQLSEDIVRNGEGVSHVIRVEVEGAPTADIARGAGKAIVNGPLVKTAIFGNDPNVGRIIGALGDYFGSSGIKLRRETVVISLGGITIFKDNQFKLDGGKEKQLQTYLANAAYSLSGNFPPHDRSVEIRVSLGCGRHKAAVLGADLTYDYVRENAAYRS